MVSGKEVKKGIIYNIQRYTIHDGPGIRTEIFMKGCYMKCRWCSNPESINPELELGINQNRCVGVSGCGNCIKVCPLKETPLRVVDNKVVSVDREKCVKCFECAKVCYIKGIRIWGEEMTVDEIMEVILRDRKFYAQSKNGGVTLNGGEVMVQWEFALELLRACRKEKVHTCVETALVCKPEILEKFFGLVDVMITDIKHMDSEIHKANCGLGNERILSNICKAVEAGQPLVIRIPFVPGFSDTEENFHAVGRFVSEKLHNHILQLQVLPYMKLGTDKYESLGQEYPMGLDFSFDKQKFEEDRQKMVDLLRTYGVPAVNGSHVAYM